MNIRPPSASQCGDDAPRQSGVNPEQRLAVRPFEPKDRGAVREICCDTADRGEPVENFFDDRELVADLVTRYYTDFEPQSSWVAECDGNVVGYLTGTLDTTRCRQVTFRRITPRAVWHAVRRGVLWRASTWRMLWNMRHDWQRARSIGQIALIEYPAHFHVNVRKGFRGKKLAPQLMERFFEQVKAAGVRGVHANVHGGNVNGRHFFEAMGFAPLSPSAHGDEEAQTSIVYGKPL